MVGLTGLGRTLAGGHLHEVRWGHDELRETFDLVSGPRVDSGELVVQALIQWAEVTDDRESLALQIARDLKTNVEQVLASPFVLIGSVGEMAFQIRHSAERWGINSYVVRARAIDDMAKVISLLDRF